MQAYGKVGLVNVGQGEVTSARGWIKDVLQALQAERVPCPHPDAMLGYKLFSQELLPAGEKQTQRELRNFQPGFCPYKLGPGKHCSRHTVVLQFMTHKHFEVSDRNRSQFMESIS